MLSDLPEDLLVQISCAFYLFDTDKDGLLKPKDFLKALSKNQISLPESNAKDIVGNYKNDENQETDVTMKDFISLINLRIKNERNVENEEEILEMFKIFDKKGTGKISLGDVRSVLDDIDEPISQQELEDLMLNWDKDKDGFLDYSEFKEMMTNV